MFDWEDLRYFVALSQEESLAKAAPQLKVDHATVARRLASLAQASRPHPRAYVLITDGERIAERGKEVWLSIHDDLRHAPAIRSVMQFIANCFPGDG
jgi:DNA-binding transcriptional LysR family regulator